MNHTTDQLITLLSDPDGTTRREAALALGARHDGTPLAANALVERLTVEADGCVREDLTWATVQHIDHALPQVLDMLGDGAPDTRRTGAHVLSKVGDPTHLDALAPLVGDPHPDVAIKAYRAVANTRRPEALELLVTRLGDGDALQRDALTGAFFSFGTDAIATLTDALGSERAAVREHAADALGHLGEEARAAAEALAARATDADAEVRLAALAALGQLGETAHVLVGRFTGDADPRVAGLAARLG